MARPNHPLGQLAAVSRSAGVLAPITVWIRKQADTPERWRGLLEHPEPSFVHNAGASFGSALDPVKP